MVHGARRVLPAEIWDYSCGGADSETTLRRNRTAFAEIAFRPRVLRGVGIADRPPPSSGYPWRCRFSSPRSGRSRRSIPMAPSPARAWRPMWEREPSSATLSHPAIEEVRAGSTAPLFFQLSVYGDRAWLEALVDRVESRGIRRNLRDRGRVHLRPTRTGPPQPALPPPERRTAQSGCGRPGRPRHG
ncbi:MAG: alpha-hydroxy-acid oxidizing protein [Geodermatophilaceae bacterium]|nr:alpha-hydroxy-acid oxidizing protein [Geodermatophilaceae bacterium]